MAAAEEARMLDPNQPDAMAPPSFRAANELRRREEQEFHARMQAQFLTAQSTSTYVPSHYAH